MTLSEHDRQIWLQERTLFSGLEDATLTVLNQALQVQQLGPQQTVVAVGEPAEGLYILESGCIEQSLDSVNARSFLPGSILNVRSLLLQQPVEATVMTVTDSTLWFLDRDTFETLIATYPDLNQLISQRLAAEVQQLASQLSYEQERQAILRPYLVTKARRGVIGRSRYAVRLRQQIRDAFDTCQSVLVFGEPGLEKDNIAALIHYGSRQRRQPIIQVDCARLQASGAELFGRQGGKPGLLTALGDGTLILNNVQELPTELVGAIAHLLTQRTYHPVSQGDGRAPAQRSTARFILISEKPMAALDAGVDRQIRVPPCGSEKPTSPTTSPTTSA
jgi:transcriptional regulator with AAA-type ATPase domain